MSNPVPHHPSDPLAKAASKAKPPRDPRFSGSRHTLTSVTTRKGSEPGRFLQGRTHHPIKLIDGIECDATELEPGALLAELQRRSVPGIDTFMGKGDLIARYGAFLDAQDAAEKTKRGR